MKILIAAGGTGGHIYPGLAVAQEIKRRDLAAEVLFVGGHYGLESELIKRSGFEIKLIHVRALERSLSLKALAAPFVFLVGLCQSIILVKKFRPRSILVTGGYVSLPVALAGRLWKIPVFLQEQNVLPGLVSRLVSRLASKIFLSFSRSLKFLPGEVSGNPVRREIIEADRAEARKRLGFTDQDFVVLVLGGSLGARRLNEAVFAAAPLLSSFIKIIHIVGKRDFPLFPKAIEYLHDMSGVLAAADLVVSRAGATAISEFLVRGLPMVLVPFPYAADDHQRLNAAAVVEEGAGLMVEDNEFTAERLLELLNRPRADYDKMKTASQRLGRPEAAARIVDQLYA